MLVHLPNLPEGGGIGSLDAVLLAFGNPYVLTAGWIHYLAFDLFIGSWELRDTQNQGIPHWQLVPCLLLTFAFGPVVSTCISSCVRSGPGNSRSIPR
ncbi:ABA4-like family protein [Gammaproteobacteria bacterium]|nr:ABA4-like family protein [Gammaproteobacteria bacterium]